MSQPKHKTAALSHLLAGPVGHVAVNALGNAAHHGSNLAEILAHKGLEHGITEAVVNPGAMRTIKSLMGPEATGAYEMAHAMGRKLVDMNPAQREAWLKATANAPIKEETPLIGALRRAARHQVEGTVPTLEAKGVGANLYSRAVNKLTDVVNKPFDTGLQRAVNTAVGAAPLAAITAADPIGMAAHGGINALREGVAATTAGKDFFRRELHKGAIGVPRSKALEVAGDYLLSPAVQDSYRMGRSVRGQTPEHLRQYLTPETIDSVAKELQDPLVQSGIKGLQERALKWNP